MSLPRLSACSLLALATALPASADGDDLAQVQGKWQRLARDREGKTIRIEKEHKGTPWAVQAKRDKAAALGLEWQPYTRGASKPIE